MKYLKVTSDFNWADEINFPSGCILHETLFNDILDFLTKLEYPICIGVGSNEEVEFKNSNDIIRGCTFSQITEEQYINVLEVVGESWGNLSLLTIVEEKFEDEWYQFLISKRTE